ncbi:MAG: DUF4126 family protein [Pyrinomonadaceae bacterium]
MDAILIYLAAGVIGISSGLRCFTAVAAVSVAAHFGWLDLSAGRLAFMSWTVTAVVFTVLALGEYVGDKLPGMSDRTATPALVARLISGVLAGASLASVAGASVWIAALTGAMGSVVGAFGGYEARTRTVKSLGVKDIYVAIPEDVLAIVLAAFCIYVAASFSGAGAA